MKRYDVVLCDKTFCTKYIRSIYPYEMQEEDFEYQKIFAQHRVILSKKLLDVYKNYSQKNNKAQEYSLFETWFSSMAYTAKNRDRFVFVNDSSDKTEDIDSVLQMVLNKRIPNLWTITRFVA